MEEQLITAIVSTVSLILGYWLEKLFGKKKKAE